VGGGAGRDAVCTFNPVYGQGMTIAALGAEVLEACLEERRDGDLDGLSNRFQRKPAKVNAPAWAMAPAQDLRVPGVIGGSANLVERLMGRYMDVAVELSTESERVRLILLEAMNMLKPPSALFGPTVAPKVLGRALVGRYLTMDALQGTEKPNPQHVRH